MKYRSLMYQGFRLSRKNLILQFVLMFLWIGMTWGVIVSASGDDIVPDTIVSNIVISTAMIGGLTLFMDDNLKADLNSNWMCYSYALPITPMERTVSRFVQRFSVVIILNIVGLCNCAALCKYTGEDFGANYIVWHFLMLSALILLSLPNEIFLLRSRTSEEFQKMRNTAGFANLAIMIAVVAVIFKVNDVDIAKLADGDILVKMPVFDMDAFAWAVPLLIVMMAASLAASYFSLRRAYRGRTKRKADVPEVGARGAIGKKSGGTVGFLYKELRQNKTVLIIAAAAPFALTVFPFCCFAVKFIAKNTTLENFFSTATNSIIRFLMLAIGIFIVSGLMSEVFKGDDKKLWAYFITSSPKGIKGFLYNKYVVTFLINIIYMISWIFADQLLATVNYFVLGKELLPSMMTYIMTAYLLMLISALDIPFTVRYGSKKGSLIKMISLLGICTAAVFTFVLLPETIQEKLANAVISLVNGDGSDKLLIAIKISNFVSLAAFLLSYKVSCKLFLKGVNEYDK